MFDYFYCFDKAFAEAESEIQEKMKYIRKRRWYEYKEIDHKRILMYDVSGVLEKDVTVRFESNGYKGSITISGETKTEFGTFRCNDRFEIPLSYMGEDSCYYIKDGILYIEIVADKKNNFELKKKVFE